MSAHIYSGPSGRRTIRLVIPWDDSGTGLIPPGKLTFMQWVGDLGEHVPVDFIYTGFIYTGEAGDDE